MVYYPIIIPTLNRYEHFRRCVESLAKNTHADKTELVIGLDFPPAAKYEEGYKLIKAYLPTIKGFKKVTVFERKENMGAVANNLALIDYVFERYDAVIATEDDNEFSPCFLDYMNKMLAHYKDDPRVYNVSAYLQPVFSGCSDTGLLFTKEYNAWGSGTWKHKNPTIEERHKLVRSVLGSIKMSWKSFWTYPAVFRMMMTMVKKNAMWSDVSKCQFNIFNNTYQVRPMVSLVRNWGNDGSGVNCTIDHSLQQQPISQEKFFYEPKSWEPFYLRCTAWATFRLAWPRNPLIFAGKMMITVCLYVAYRLGR